MNANPSLAVQQSFNRAAASYSASAELQHTVADALLAAIQAALPNSFSGRILDAGCGTGYCLNRLQRLYPNAELIGIDFAAAMLHQVSHARCINGDLQQLPIATSSVDLYVSSLVWQWCKLDQALAEASRVLKPGAQLWLTTLMQGTFAELGSALCQAGLTPERHLLTTINEAEVRAAFSNHPFHDMTFSNTALTTWHPDFASLRRSIRGVGANHLPTQPEAIDRIQRQHLIEAYETQRTPQGLPLTYQVLTIHARRR